MENILDKYPIRDLYMKGGKEEFEAIFFPFQEKLNLQQFSNLLQFLKYLSTKAGKLDSTTSLDIALKDRDNSLVRVTIHGDTQINYLINNYERKRNNIALRLIVHGDTNLPKDKITMIRKNKSDKVDVEEYNLRIRSSDELDLTDADLKVLQNLDYSHDSKISFRYKQRVSLIRDLGNDLQIRVDLTSVKNMQLLSSLNETAPKYELEVELINKKRKREDLVKFVEQIEQLMKVIQQSNHVLSMIEKNRVLTSYQTLSGLTQLGSGLNARQTVTLERQMLDKLLNMYAVTDKADGDRYFLIVVDEQIYIVSMALDVRKLGIKAPGLNGTILDGEYVRINKYNKYVFLAFDCLVFKETNMKNESDFMKRLEKADEFVETLEKNKSPNRYSGEMKIKSIEKFYRQDVTRFIEQLDKDLQKDPHIPIIRRKYFCNTFNIQKNEIFTYAKILWEIYSQKSPYNLDGLVFHPKNQQYIVRNAPLEDLKWKPQKLNSIDFYLQFERTKDKQEIKKCFDNLTSKEKDKPFRIANLYVGRYIAAANEEIPVLFREAFGDYVVHLYEEDDNVRDVEGRLLQDKTVVEFYYEATNPQEYRWVPLRTRYDKTEFVQRYKRKYGNAENTANRNWRSIVNPITEEDIEILSNVESFDKHLAYLAENISIDAKREVKRGQKETPIATDVYYQKQSEIAIPMRRFHNWIKTNMISTYCSPIYDKKKKVLDIACGRGGDLSKFFYANVEQYLGLDYDYAGLASAPDNAKSRLANLRKRNASVSLDYYFAQADATTPFNVELQSKVFPKMTSENKIILEKFFGTKKQRFDIINCQFAMHYFMKNETAWNNFLNNLNNHLRPGGFFLATLFDGDAVSQLLQESKKVEKTFTDVDGKKVKLFELTSSEKDFKSRYGVSINVLNASFSEVPQTEYLVFKDLLFRDFEEKCGMSVVESVPFSQIYEIHRKYFGDIKKFAFQPKKQYLEIKEYYDLDNEMNRASMTITNLNRLYVFRKHSESK